MVNGVFSKNVRICSGSPQGSVLGFLLNTSGLPMSLENTRVEYIQNHLRSILAFRNLTIIIKAICLFSNTVLV